MLDSECLEIFNKYLTEVKKCSQNTLSSYLRDIRQLSEYMETHVGDSLDKATNEELSGLYKLVKRQRQIRRYREPCDRFRQMLLRFACDRRIY